MSKTSILSARMLAGLGAMAASAVMAAGAPEVIETFLLENEGPFRVEVLLRRPKLMEPSTIVAAPYRLVVTNSASKRLNMADFVGMCTVKGSTPVGLSRFNSVEAVYVDGNFITRRNETYPEPKVVDIESDETARSTMIEVCRRAVAQITR